MKKLKIVYFLALVIVFFNSCSKDQEIQEQKKHDVSMEKIENTDFSDASKWELTLVYETLRDQETNYLLDFLNCHGMPDWDNAVFKRGEEINITNIPTVKNNGISGIFKVHHPINKNPVINYFSISDINAAIKRGDKLSSIEYHAYRGAIQGIILSSCNMGIPINQSYIDWLRLYNDRVEEKVTIYCIEILDCILDYPCPESGNTSGGMEEICEVVSKECWVEWGAINFPGSIDNTACDCGEEAGGDNMDGTHGDGQAIFNAKSDFLINWMNDNGIDFGFFDVLYQFVGYLPAPFGGIAEIFIDEDGAKIKLIEVELLSLGLSSDEVELIIEWIREEGNIGLALANKLLISKTCKSSFNFVEVGQNSYTAEVRDIDHSYGLPPQFIDYSIGEMCIQVWGEDQYGTPLTADKAAELSAYALDNARYKVFDDMSSTSTSFELRMALKDHFVDELNELTGGGNNCTVSYASCSGGNIPPHLYELSLFGIFPCVHIWDL